MLARDLLGDFARISDSRGGVDQLRSLVVRLAVAGALVEQDAREASADQALAAAKAELERLRECGEIPRAKDAKKSRCTTVGDTLPSGWSWSTLQDVAAVLDHKRVPINTRDREQRIAGKSEADLFPYFGATQQTGWIDDYLFDEELVLLGEDGVQFFNPLKPKAYVIKGKSWVNNHAHVLRMLAGESRFLAMVLNTMNYEGRVTGTTRLKLNQGRIRDIPVPLPPAAEQGRIVAKVDELLALCDELEEQQEHRQTVRRRFQTSALEGIANAETGEELAESWRRVLENWNAVTEHSDSSSALRQTITELAVRGRLISGPAGQEDDENGSTTDTAYPVSVPRRWIWTTLGESSSGDESGWSPTCEARITSESVRISSRSSEISSTAAPASRAAMSCSCT